MREEWRGAGGAVREEWCGRSGAAMREESTAMECGGAAMREEWRGAGGAARRGGTPWKRRSSSGESGTASRRAAEGGGRLARADGGAGIFGSLTALDWDLGAPVLSEMRSWGRRRGRPARFKGTGLSSRLVPPTGTKGSFVPVGATNRDERPTLSSRLVE